MARKKELFDVFVRKSKVKIKTIAWHRQSDETMDYIHIYNTDYTNNNDQGKITRYKTKELSRF